MTTASGTVRWIAIAAAAFAGFLAIGPGWAQSKLPSCATYAPYQFCLERSGCAANDQNCKMQCQRANPCE